MTPAYEKDYLNDAMVELGDMFDYAVNCCGFDMDSFFMLFINSGVAEKFEHGNPKYLGGMSGIELAVEVFRCATGNVLNLPAELNPNRTEEYWSGWLMAYCQWQTGYSYQELADAGMNMSRVLEMYRTHKTNVREIAAEARKMVTETFGEKETNLKRIRRARGLSQSQLARLSGVTLRMIQLYEQRQNDINKAQAVTVTDLAQALGCRAEDLIEPAAD